MTLAISTRIGAAASHIVCADLLLRGYTAFLAAEGARYDIVLDVRGRLLRVQAKGSTSPASRARQRPVYRFATRRADRRAPEAKHQLWRYGPDSVDLLALVAIDIRVVAYLPVVGQVPFGINFYPPATPPFIRKNQHARVNIDEAPIEEALTELGLMPDQKHGWQGPAQEIPLIRPGKFDQKEAA